MKAFQSIFLPFCLLISISLNGQTLDQRCASKPYDLSYVDQNPYALNSREPIAIPIVFHVLYQNETENISDSQILSQLDVLNNDFNAQNTDLVLVPHEFRSFIGNADICFNLAFENPDRQEQIGIIRKKVIHKEIGTKLSVDGRIIAKYSHLGGSDAWDPDRYLNVWICQRGDNLIGESTFPNHPEKAEEGIVIVPRAFGVLDDSFAPFQLGRTLTHEIGHYFGLLHPWGLEDGCSEDDFIEDTPGQESPYYGCPVHPKRSCNSADMFMNFMDYTDDVCLNFFTLGQTQFMHNTITNYRPDLGSVTTCIPEDDNTPLSEKLRFLHTTNEITVQIFSFSDQVYQIRLYDFQGQLYVSEQIQNQFIYDINPLNLASGMYIFQVISGEERLTWKFFHSNY